MSRHCGGIGCKSQTHFRLRFQKRFRELLQRDLPAAESFGPAWEAAIDAVPLEEDDQAEVYRELINWARAQYLFTAAA